MATIMTPDFKKGFAIGLGVGGVEVIKETGIRVVKALELGAQQLVSIDMNLVEDFDILISSITVTSGAILGADGKYYATMQRGEAHYNSDPQDKTYSIKFQTTPLAANNHDFNLSGWALSAARCEVLHDGTTVDCKKVLYVTPSSAIQTEDGYWVGNTEQNVELTVTNTVQTDISFTLVITITPAAV